MESPDLLGLTASLTSSTLIFAVVAGLMPRLVGDEPNPVVGIRTKATSSSPEAWQLAHQIAQPLLRRTVWTAVAGLCVQAAIGVVTGFGSVASAVASTVVCLAVLVAMLYAALKGNAAAKSLRR
ncbi:SdpI family protein [Rhodococcus sp. IEGM 1409]|uniref:SdpI family protein n=1 Tax=Rhodococcus sp. IEGM 1409 TaxID=3047082 RepID=UPI0024B6D7E4|nr:SdpI family protein [Rhodococcus sp. IEGM 1409]MDI9902634.1 SdpI family protein [Rhodococcus sp. IEGM 1409]